MLTSWRELRHRLLERYRKADRRDRTERELQSRIQVPNEVVAMYVEDMTLVLKRADPDMAEDIKLRHLVPGVKEQLFAILVRSSPKNAAEFLTEAVTMEKVLSQWSGLFDRQVNVPSAPEFATFGGSNTEWIREIVRADVREEMEKHHGVREPVVGSITCVMRDELQQALRSHRNLLMPNAVRADVGTAPVLVDIQRRSYEETL